MAYSTRIPAGAILVLLSATTCSGQVVPVSQPSEVLVTGASCAGDPTGCVSGDVCDDGFCFVQTVTACTDNSACDTDTSCDVSGGFCVCACPTCTDSSACGPRFECDSGICIPVDGTGGHGGAVGSAG